MASADVEYSITDYELLRLIGRGSYGDVWLAKGITGVYRAIKIVRRDRFPDAQPFEREFRGIRQFAAISLSEPRQLALLHVGRAPDFRFFYYVMELADDVSTGRTIQPETYVPCSLTHLRERDSPLPFSKMVLLAVELTRALSSLHAHGLIHRDIKPSNVLIIGGAPKLADIGLVTAAHDGVTYVGTDGYVPPEGPGASSADVYGLGKVLYELATGLDRKDYPRLPDLEQIPDRAGLLEFNEILIRACEPNVQKRYPDAQRLLDDLLLLQAGKSVRRLRSTERRLSRVTKALALFATVAVVAGLGVVGERSRAQSETRLRQLAEADRERLARRNLYVGRIAQVQQAIREADLNRAAQGLLRAAEVAENPAALELRALKALMGGGPREVLRDAGYSITAIYARPDGQRVAVHDTSSEITEHAVETNEIIRRISNCSRLFGYTPDGKLLVGCDRQGALCLWPADDPLAAPAVCALPPSRPVGLLSSTELLIFVKGTPGRMLVWNWQTQSASLSLPLPLEKENGNWELDRASQVDAESRQALVGMMRGRGSYTERALLFADLHGTGQVVLQSPGLRPTLIGRAMTPGQTAIWWAATDSSGELRERDPVTGEWVPAERRLPRGTSAVFPSAAVSDTTTFLASRTRLLEVNGSASRTRKGHFSTVTALAAPAGGNWVFTGSMGGELFRWSRTPPYSRTLMRQCWNSFAGTNRALFSPDAETLYVPCAADPNAVPVVEVLRSSDLQPLARLTGMRRPIAVGQNSVWGLSSDGLGLAYYDGTKTTEHARGTELIAYVGATADCARFVVSRLDGQLEAFDARTDTIVGKLDGTFRDAYTLELDPNSPRMWTIDNARELVCRTYPDFKEVWKRDVPVRAATMRYVPSLQAVLVALVNGDLQYVDAATGNILRTVPCGTSSIESLAVFEPDNRVLVASSEGDVHVLELGTGEYVTALPFELEDDPHFLSIAPNAGAIAVLTKTGKLHVLTLP